MTCATPGSPDYDLRDYYFHALEPEANRQVKEHVNRCQACGAELEQLRLTALALNALPEEEIPRRIAFVSDKVFAPSQVTRWFQSFWLSGARLGAVAAMFLAMAILVHAYHPAKVIRVVEKQAPVTRTAQVDQAALQATMQANMQAAVDRAVAQAVSEAENRYDVKLKRIVVENEKQKRETMSRVAEVLDSMDRRNRVMTVASNRVLDLGQ